MKHLPINLLIIALLLIIVSGCESRKQELKSKSPDGSAEIIVSGIKTSMDPWKLTIEISKDGKKNQSETEMYAEELNDQTVQFLWDGNSRCTLKLIEQDGTIRPIEIQL